MNFNNAGVESIVQPVPVVGFGKRFLAYLIDYVVLIILSSVIGCGFGFVGVALAESSRDAASLVNLFVQCLSVLVSASYFVVFWAATGQTLGKMALGIKVVSTDGSPVSWGKALLRYVGYIISGIPLFLGFIWVAFDAKRQGWHDKIASTYVVPKDAQFTPGAVAVTAPADAAGGAMAVVVALVGLALVLILVAIVVIAILLLLGPVVGNVFSNIILNL